MDDDPKTRGRPRAFDKEAALEAAMELFWKQGFEATSLGELTSAMGVAPPSLYAAFGNKQALFLEAVRHYGETHGSYIQRALDEEPTALGAIERLLREGAALFTRPRKARGCLVALGAANGSSTSAEVQEALCGMRRQTEAAIHRRIQSDVKAGRLHPEVDAALIARSVGTFLGGMAVQARDGTSRAELEATVAVVVAGIQANVKPRGFGSGRNANQGG